ncbi:DNA-binding response regulator [Streptomyces sp. Act143]|uniref:response regulator transcription factor n=1 Tax=Streptomyces sp. Act143 TaxID=2200760 RepID=UPI000D67E530|nr:response regulator transcription factor [Streptomyces sp. Act143]PWI18426.1 DNA-binding response regulator [Streptomyces sp. Act143]
MCAPLVLIALHLDRPAEVIASMLREQGYRVERTADGAAAERALLELSPDALLLGVHLPDCDPWKLLGRVRAVNDMPVLLFSAEYVADDAIRAYREGADDYLSYLTPSAEGFPRIVRRLTRRVPCAAGAARAAAPQNGLQVDAATRAASADGVPLALTALEFDLLSTFAEHPGQALTYEQLLRLVWHDAADSGHARVKYAVLRLRRKIAAATGDTTWISTVRGVGYRYRLPE